MRNSFTKSPAEAGRHSDGSIRCPWAFHSVLPDPDELVQFRVRVAVRGDQTGDVPVEAIRRAFLEALAQAGIEPADTDVGFVPFEHDCQALIAAEQAGDTAP